MKLAVLFLAAVSAWGGQSLAARADVAIPTQDFTQPLRIEYMFHDWNIVSGGRPFRFNAAAFDCNYASSQVSCTTSSIVNGVGDTVVITTSWPTTNVYFRYMFDPVGLTVSYEWWDLNGTVIHSVRKSFTSVNTANWTTNGFMRDFPSIGDVAFVRVHSTLVPFGSRPPTTVDNDNRLYEWKFDGSLTASAGGVNATGSVSYVATPNQNVISLPRVNPTEWSSWTSMRAGTSNTLTGDESYSQDDASNTVTCFWQVTGTPAGAPLPTLSSHTACNPTITGLVFGTYTFQLVATGSSGNTNTATIQAGAVATDSNGVVVPADPTIANVLGPMIAFGRNPWGYADDTHLRGMTVRSAYYDTVSPPSWETFQSGTVNYRANVVGGSAAVGTLAVAVSSTTQMTIELNPGHTASLADFPTYISIGTYPGGGSNSEQICIASAAGNVLTVCPEGRGWANTTATTALVGANVWQNKVTGSGTSFLSVFCPAGQGLEGQISYSTGTVALTAGSTTVTGTGTTWTGENNVYAGRWIRVEGVSGGQPFVFTTNITVVNSTTQLTLGRAYPATATNVSGVTYHIITPQSRYFTAQWTRPDATEGLTVYSGLGTCASDASYYYSGGYEVYTGAQTGKSYSYTDSLWMTSGGNGTPNYYDEVLANYALWLRSGYEPALLAARKLGQYWLTQPLADEGWVPVTARNMSLAGPVIAAVADGQTDNWYAIRKFADIGVTATTNTGCTANTRENAYQLMWLAFAANYDPVDTGNPATPGQRSYWKAKLADSYTRDNGCKRSDNSFMNGAEWTASSAMSVTSGSRTVTGTGFTSAICNWTAEGTGTIVNGAGSFTVSTGTLVAGGKVIITGTRSGSPYNVAFEFSGTSGTVQLGGTWLGDTGAIDWQTDSSSTTTITWHDGATLTDGDRGEMYGCKFVSSTELTLNRPWTGATTSDLRRFSQNIPGWGTQPFILGIKTWQMSVAAEGADEPTATNYQTLAANAATWISTEGYDPVTAGLYYARGYPNCDPVVGAGDYTSALSRQVGCNYTAAYRGSAIALNAEAQNALRLWYEASPTAPNLAVGDAFYASSWGAEYVEPGYATSTNDNVYAETGNLNAGKWYGFQFGVGMAHQWPAVRVGGVAPESLVSVPVSARLADVSGAGSIKVTATRPNSTTSTAVCTSGPCTIQVDSRQGPQWLLTIEYYSGVDGTGTRLAIGTQVSSGS